MKKTACFLSLISCLSFSAFAENVMFGDAQNQLRVSPGMTFAEHYPERPSGLAMIEYAQPVQFLRLDSRINLHGAVSANRDNIWVIGGGSLDVALLKFGRFYAGPGFGMFYRNHQSPRVNSKFMFGLRAFAGYRITDSIGAELFIQHFSNGDLTPINHGYNYTGVSIVWNF